MFNRPSGRTACTQHFYSSDNAKLWVCRKLCDCWRKIAVALIDEFWSKCLLIREERKNRLARPERFELPTYSSGGCRSIQLSYGRVVQVYIGDSNRINLPAYEFSARKNPRCP